jgi:transcriptional regulator with XRE-family HTH domain
MNNRIAELRKALKLSQERFADVLVLSHATVSQIESGKARLTERNI